MQDVYVIMSVRTVVVMGILLLVMTVFTRNVENFGNFL